jgi:hypothetical protein
MPNTMQSWTTLKPGVVFRFDNKLYLRTQHHIIALEDFAQVGLHSDVKVAPVSKIRVKDHRAEVVAMTIDERLPKKNYHGYSCIHCGGGHLGINCPEDWLRTEDD